MRRIGARATYGQARRSHKRESGMLRLSALLRRLEPAAKAEADHREHLRVGRDVDLPLALPVGSDQTGQLELGKVQGRGFRVYFFRRALRAGWRARRPLGGEPLIEGSSTRLHALVRRRWFLEALD